MNDKPVNRCRPCACGRSRHHRRGRQGKALLDGCFVLDASEHRRLDGFESMFGIPVWYACFPPEEPGASYLFRNRELADPTVIHVTNQQIIRAPLALAVTVQHHRIPFGQVFSGANP